MKRAVKKEIDRDGFFILNLLIFGAVLFIIIGIQFFNLNFNFTGKVVQAIDTQNSYNLGDKLNGSVTIGLEENDSISNNTEIIIGLKKGNDFILTKTISFNDFFNMLTAFEIKNESDNSSAYYFNKVGDYSRNIGEFIDYNFSEIGNYSLIISIPSLNITEEKNIVVGDEYVPSLPNQQMGEQDIVIMSGTATDGSTVYRCGDITSSGFYVLNQSINTTSGDCITISADNVVLDGAGFSINTTNGNVIRFSGASLNNTIKNSKLNGQISSCISGNTCTGISYGSTSTNDKILNNSFNAILQSNYNGIYFNGVVSYGTIANNTIDATYVGGSPFNAQIWFNTNSDHMNIINNSIISKGTQTFGNGGILLGTSLYDNITNNFINSSYNPILISSSTNGTIINNTIITSNDWAIEYSGTTIGNTLTRNNITSQQYSGIVFLGSASDNVINGANRINSGTVGCSDTTYYCSGIIYLTNSNRNVIDGNVITTNQYGSTRPRSIYYYDPNFLSSYNNLTNNNITSPNGYGIYSYPSSLNNKYVNNNINSYYFPIYLSSNVNNTLFLNNNFTSPYDYAIFGGAYYYDNLTNNIINSVMSNGISINSISHSILTNNTISSDPYYYNLNLPWANNLSLIDQKISTYSFLGPSNLTFVNTTYGIISLKNMNGTGENLIGNSTSDIQMGNNSVYVNSSQTGLNVSGNITLYNIGNRFSNPMMARNGFLCSSSICSNSTLLNATNVIFGVTEWSNYSIANNFNINSCGVIDSPGTYTLISNVNSIGTCFNIISENVTLDGNGKTITYGINGTDNLYGIYTNGKNNITIKNFNIYEGNRSGNVKNAIYFINSSYSTIRNNNITTIGSWGSGIYSRISLNNSITSNTVLTNSSDSSGIYLYAISGVSSNSTINLNIIATNGSYAHGIYLYATSGGSLISNKIISNTILTTGSFGRGISLEGYIGGDVNYNLVASNTILTTGSSGYGIRLDSNSKLNVIDSNILNISKADRIYTWGGPTYPNNFTNNSIINRNYAFYDINFAFNGNNETWFIDQYFENYSFKGVDGTINVKNSQYGQINFINPVNGTGTNFSNDVIIGNNSVYVNSSAASRGLNKSANITLYNLPINFYNPKIIRDGQYVCNSTTSPACSNFTSLNAGNVTFNVSSWSNYSIMEFGVYFNGSSSFNQEGILGGDVRRGENLTINATVLGNTNGTSVILKIWQGIIGTSTLIWQGTMTFISGIWNAIVPTTWQFPTGQVNYSVFANNSYGSNSTLVGTFNMIEGTNVTECRTLDTAGTYYILLNDVNSTGTCFNITADNVTLDGNGNNITYGINGTIGLYGIYTNGKNNITIKNSNILQGNSSGNGNNAVYLINSNYSTIQNDNITTNSTNGMGIYFDLVKNSTIYSNRISTNSSGAYGIWLKSSSNFNNITSNIIMTNVGDGIFCLSTNLIISKNNIITNSGTGMYLSGNSNSTIDSNTISSTTGNGINLAVSSNYNLITSNTINVSNADRIVFYSTLGMFPKNNNLTNNTIINRNYSYSDINFQYAGINGTWFIDQYFENYNFTGLGGTINVQNSQYGQIMFNVPVNGSGTNLSNDIQISYNSAYVNSVQTGLNKSANITLYNLPDTTGYGNQKIYRDGSPCNSTTSVKCFNFSALTDTNVSFNVSSGGNYSIYIGDDIAPPIISLNSPANGLSTTSTSFTFSYTVRDSSSTNCSLIFDGNISNFDSSVYTNEVLNSFTNSTTIGSHSWSINCTDSFNNVGNSSIRSLIVTAPLVPVTPSGGSGGGGSIPVKKNNLSLNNNTLGNTNPNGNTNNQEFDADELGENNSIQGYKQTGAENNENPMGARILEALKSNWQIYLIFAIAVVIIIFVLIYLLARIRNRIVRVEKKRR